ncbi:MAG: prepilin-type N-terminal cleavage/methylation domain-containing protein [Kofleriaceae bacterium]
MRRTSRGMTMLEIMIVLAIIALVMGLIIGPKLMDHYRSSQVHIARMAVTRFAEQDYPMWALEHSGQQCPASIAELEHKQAQVDPWGTPYKAYCRPIGETAFGAASFGPDVREATDDDIDSWR